MSKSDGILLISIIVLVIVAAVIFVPLIRNNEIKTQAIASFDKAFTEGTLDIELNSNLIKLATSGNPMHGSISPQIPVFEVSRAGIYVGFTPRVYNIFKCAEVWMPINASGIYAITSSEDWQKVEIIMPESTDKAISICANAGYMVEIVMWAKKG